MRRGFTLLEVILAVTILALIGTMIYGGFSQTALNKARVEEGWRSFRLAVRELDWSAEPGAVTVSFSLGRGAFGIQRRGGEFGLPGHAGTRASAASAREASALRTGKSGTSLSHSISVGLGPARPIV